MSGWGGIPSVVGYTTGDGCLHDEARDGQIGQPYASRQASGILGSGQGI
jgi:hypothetical protein